MPFFNNLYVKIPYKLVPFNTGNLYSCWVLSTFLSVAKAEMTTFAVHHQLESMTQQFEFSLPAYARGFHLITNVVVQQLGPLPRSGILHLFIKHTSAGLTINENADPSVRVDFENIFNRMVPENEPYLTHTLEGPDDMPAHIKSALVGASVTVPISGGILNFGTWQGIYLCEFRNNGGRRRMVATIWS